MKQSKISSAVCWNRIFDFFMQSFRNSEILKFAVFYCFVGGIEHLE